MGELYDVIGEVGSCEGRRAGAGGWNDAEAVEMFGRRRWAGCGMMWWEWCDAGGLWGGYQLRGVRSCVCAPAGKVSGPW